MGPQEAEQPGAFKEKDLFQVCLHECKRTSLLRARENDSGLFRGVVCVHRSTREIVYEKGETRLSLSRKCVRARERRSRRRMGL